MANNIEILAEMRASQTSRLTSFEQVVWLVQPPSGPHRPLTPAQTGHTYVAYGRRRQFVTPSSAVTLSERYHLRLHQHALELTVYRGLEEAVPAFGPLLISFRHVRSIKFYYGGEARIRLLFRQASVLSNSALVDSAGGRLFSQAPLQQLDLLALVGILGRRSSRLLNAATSAAFGGRQGRALYMNFPSEAERLRLLSALRLARLIDFRTSPAPAVGGFTVAFPANGFMDVPIVAGGIVNEGFEDDEEEMED